MKKSTKYILGVGAAVALAAGLYVPDAVKEAREKRAEEKEKARQEQLAEQKRIEDERADQLKKEANAVYNHANDSVLAVMGYDDGEASIRYYETKEKLYDIASLSQKTILRQNVDTLIAQHCRQTAKEIINFLGKYNVPVRDYDRTWNRSAQEVVEELVRGEYFDYAIHRTWANSEYANEDEKSNALKASMPWEMFGNSGNDEYDSWCKYAVDWKDSEYGEIRQQEIQNGVLKIFDKINANLDNALRAECKKFAVYYPSLDLSQVPAEYAELCKAYYGDPIDYDEDHGFRFEYAGEIYVSREVSVYDSKLDVNFFGEEGATYKLVKVADGKWQVVKTDKNGRVTKTPVFSHNVDYEYTICGGGYVAPYSFDYDFNKQEYVWHNGEKETKMYANPDSWDEYIDFEPGRNMGVHVRSSKMVWIKEAKKSIKYPDPDGKIAAKRDSLAKEATRLAVLADQMDQIAHVADSVAQAKRQAFLARQGQRGH